MRYFAPVVVALLLSAAAVLEPASAQPNRARQGVQSGEVRSLDEILNGIRRERPGSLADVEGPNFGPSGEPHYRLKWLTPDGRVLWLDTDARTGRVLGVQGDDRGPGPGAAPAPRGAQGQTRPRPNFNGPADDYDFGAPGIRPPRGGARTRRPVPEQNFAPGQQPDMYGPPPGVRRGPPPPPNYRRGPAPPGFDRGPVQRQRFDGGPPPQQRFNGAPNPPRNGFRNGNGFGGGTANRSGPRPPRGERGPRNFR
jgi:hypothetical protein